MKAHFRNLFLVLLSFWVWSCGTSESDTEEVVEEKSGGEVEIATYQNLIGVGMSKDAAWTQHWTELLGGFNPSDFQLVFTDSIDPMEMPETNPILPEDPLFPYQFPHPEGNGTVDIYLYKVEAQESLDKPFLNPDSEVIWFREDGMKERLLFMGPSGMFEDGMWLNATEFLVLGYFQEEEGFVPMAWIIDVENHVFRQFKLDKVAKEYNSMSFLDKKLKSVKLS